MSQELFDGVKENPPPYIGIGFRTQLLGVLDFFHHHFSFHHTDSAYILIDLNLSISTLWYCFFSFVL